MSKRNTFKRSTPADEMLTHRRAWRLDDSHFKVWSRDADREYKVRLESAGELVCTCPAGLYGEPTCWHRGAVARRLLREGLPPGLCEPEPDEGTGELIELFPYGDGDDVA